MQLNEEQVLEYLDGAIRQWRKHREEAYYDPIDSEYEMDMAVHYIDAFQSVRVSLFGETLPVEE